MLQPRGQFATASRTDPLGFVAVAGGVLTVECDQLPAGRERRSELMAPAVGQLRLIVLKTELQATD
jgi:hypothetical protein